MGSLVRKREDAPRQDGSVEGLATAIYGTILSTALIAAYSEDPGSDPVQVAVAVIVAALVFWIAHAYSDALAGGLVGRNRGGMARIRAELAREWPLVTGAALPVLPLLLSPLGILSDYNAESVAIASGVVLLTGVGVAIAWRQGSGLLGIAFSAAASAVFGIVVVTLKAIVH
jgi:hypothetical protein